MAQDIRFGTYNVGSGFYDYTAMANGNDQEIAKLQLIENIESKAKQDEVMKEIEEKMAEKLAGELDVIALQEVGRLTRPFAQKLQEKGFTIQPAPTRAKDGYFSCAIAYKTKLGSIKDISILSMSSPNERRVYGQAIGALILKVESGARIAFASLHSWGFQLYPMDHKHKQYDEHDKEQQGYAVTYAQEAVNLLANQWVDGALIGGDMNNNPENYEKGFVPFSNAGYWTYRADGPTNVNYIDKTSGYGLRIIDFIFSNFKRSLLSRVVNAVYSLFFTTFEVRAYGIGEAALIQGFDFNLDSNCSDHKPVAITLRIETHLALITRVKKAIVG